MSLLTFEPKQHASITNELPSRECQHWPHDVSGTTGATGNPWLLNQLTVLKSFCWTRLGLSRSPSFRVLSSTAASFISTRGVCTHVGKQAEIPEKLRYQCRADTAPLSNLETTTPRGDTIGTTLTLGEYTFDLDRAGGQFPSRANLSSPCRPRITTGTCHRDLDLH